MTPQTTRMTSLRCLLCGHSCDTCLMPGLDAELFRVGISHSVRGLSWAVHCTAYLHHIAIANNSSLCYRTFATTLHRHAHKPLKPARRPTDGQARRYQYRSGPEGRLCHSPIRHRSSVASYLLARLGRADEPVPSQPTILDAIPGPQYVFTRIKAVPEG